MHSPPCRQDKHPLLRLATESVNGVSSVMQLIIRRLLVDDIETIRNVWQEAGLPYKPGGRESHSALSMEMSNPDVAFFGVDYDSRLAGVVIANFDGRRGWINRLAVLPRYRGIGLAGLLIQACEEFLKSRGAIVYSALIDEINAPSITAFQKEGFQCVEAVRYFSKYLHAEA